ncbi:MAG: hypothetical protein ACI8W7_005071, partial [Gammaproteobacteria bacterium]
ANADLGGLLNWVRARRDSMNKEGQTIFRDLQRLDLDLVAAREMNQSSSPERRW